MGRGSLPAEEMANTKAQGLSKGLLSWRAWLEQRAEGRRAEVGVRGKKDHGEAFGFQAERRDRNRTVNI